MAILSFVGRVHIAVRIVTGTFPEAQLLEADGVASSGVTTDPAQIDQLRIVFRNEGNTTVIIREIAYGEFGEPQLIPEPWLGDIPLPWPVAMDLPRAVVCKQKAGYPGAYRTITLRNPLGPHPGNPCFIFGDDIRGPFIFVDTVTEAVHAVNFDKTSTRLPKRHLELLAMK